MKYKKAFIFKMQDIFRDDLVIDFTFYNQEFQYKNCYYEFHKLYILLLLRQSWL